MDHIDTAESLQHQLLIRAAHFLYISLSLPRSHRSQRGCAHYASGFHNQYRDCCVKRMRCLILLWWWWLATFTEYLIHAEFQRLNIFSKHTQYFVFHIFCISEEGHSDVMSPLYAREFVLHSSPIQLARPKRERIVRWPVVLICALHSTLIFSYCCVRYTQNDQLWWWVSECPMSIRYARTLIQHHVLCVYMCSVNMHLFQLFFFFCCCISITVTVILREYFLIKQVCCSTGQYWCRALVWLPGLWCTIRLNMRPLFRIMWIVRPSCHIHIWWNAYASVRWKHCCPRRFDSRNSATLSAPASMGWSSVSIIHAFNIANAHISVFFFIIFLVCLVTRLRTCFIANFWNKNSHVS